MRVVFALVLLVAASACGSDEPPPPPPTQLDLRLVDSTTETALSTAWVRFEGVDTWTEVSDGRLVTDSPPGQFRVWVRAARYAPRPGPLEPEILVSIVAEKTQELTLLLDPIAAPADARATVRGRVTLDGAPQPNVLVIARGTLNRASVSDADGGYIFADIAPETFTIETRSATRQNASVSAIGMSELSQAPPLELGAAAPGGLTGTVTDGPGVWVELADPVTQFASPELRALADSAGAFALAEVPAGRYALRVGLNLDDGRVADPEAERTGGIMTVDVAATEVAVTLGSAPAIAGLSPSNTSSVSAQPTLSWNAVSGADFYVIELRDASDAVIWGGFDANGVWRFQVVGPTTEATFNESALRAGAHYRWRVFAALRDPLIGSNFTLIAASELAEGRFRVAR